eukprot:8934683-Pyramimonas_sp.AAC.1
MFLECAWFVFTTAFEANRPLMMSAPPMLEALVDTLLPPAGASVLQEHTLEATEAAAGAVWGLAGERGNHPSRNKLPQLLKP